jgi:hypothetical protein
MQIDYRTDRVVADVPSGPAPVLAVNVCIWWPAQQGAADSYYPDGRTEKDLPAGRPDLAALDAVLKRPLAVR